MPSRFPQGDDWPEDLATFLREHAPRIDVEDGSQFSLLASSDACADVVK